MAICRTCRVTIERLEGTDTWVREGTITPDGMAGDTWCKPHAEALHIPARYTTIERVLMDEPRAPECRWCAWPVTAEFYIGGEPACRTHLDDGYNYATKPSTDVP